MSIMATTVAKLHNIYMLYRAAAAESMCESTVVIIESTAATLAHKSDAAISTRLHRQRVVHHRIKYPTAEMPMVAARMVFTSESPNTRWNWCREFIKSTCFHVGRFKAKFPIKHVLD